MSVQAICQQIDHSITKLSGLSLEDRQELGQVLNFGIAAIETLEALVDAVSEPLIKAKSILYESQDSQQAQQALVQIAAGMYAELDAAQDMVFRFSALHASFSSEIAPILSAYLGPQEVLGWAELFRLTQQTRALAYERVESLIPEVETLLESRHHAPERISKDLTFKELKDYLNELIEEMRATKKALQLVRSKFLQGLGLTGLTGAARHPAQPPDPLPDLPPLWKAVEELVADGRTAAALEKLEALCSLRYPDLRDEVILFQSQYSMETRKAYSGLDSDRTTFNRIHDGILKLLAEMRSRAART